MAENMEEIIKNIEISMKMENMPLTKEDKADLRDCIKKNGNINEILEEIVRRYTYNTEYVTLRKDKEKPANKTSLVFPLNLTGWLIKIIRRL